MEDYIFDECYKAYLEGGSRIWQNLLDRYPNEFSSFDTAEGLRIAFRSERKKRGLPTKKEMSTQEVEEDQDVNDLIQKEVERYGVKTKINSDGSIDVDRLIVMSEEDEKSPNRILELNGYDPSLWSLTNNEWGLWHMQYKANGETNRRLCYSSKIRVQPKTSVSGMTIDDIEEVFKDLLNKKQIEKTHIPDKNSNSDTEINVLEYILADAHWGSNGVYDNDETTETLYKKSIWEVVEKCKGKKVDKIIFAGIGDLLHFDSKSRSTSAGTKLDTNGMTVKQMFDKVIDMLIYGIDVFADNVTDNIHVVGLIGNHDATLSFALYKALSLYYYHNPNIFVDDGEESQKFYHFGKCLIGWSHGDMPKKNSQNWIQIRARKEFGQSDFISVRSGHLHHYHSEEVGGVEYTGISSLTHTDEWAEKNGYIGAIRRTQAFLWSSNRGCLEMWHVGN